MKEERGSVSFVMKMSAKYAFQLNDYKLQAKQNIRRRFICVLYSSIEKNTLFSCHILIILCKSTRKISVCRPITSSIFLLHWMGFDILLTQNTIDSLSDDWKIFEWDIENVTWKIWSIFPLAGNFLTHHWRSFNWKYCGKAISWLIWKHVASVTCCYQTNI